MMARALSTKADGAPHARCGPDNDAIDVDLSKMMRKATSACQS
jgi:hypothetical protein